MTPGMIIGHLEHEGMLCGMCYKTAHKFEIVKLGVDGND